MPARADDEVIHDRYPEEPAGRDRVAGRPKVVGGRLGVARGMVVREDDPRGVPAERLSEELADTDRRPSDVPFVHGGDGDESLLAREERDDDGLAIAVGEVWCEDARRRAWGIEHVTFTLGRERAPAELEGRDHTRRRRRSEAERAQVRSGEPARAADGMEQRLGHRE